MVMPMFLSMRGGGFPGGGMFVVGSLVYLVPGVAFMVFSVFLGHRKFWAVVGALVVSSMLGLLILVSAASVSILVLSSETPVFIAIMLAIFLFLLVAIGQLIYHLAKSFEAIKYPPFGQELRGFEPLPVRPVFTVQAPAPSAAADSSTPPSKPPAELVDTTDTTDGPAAPR